MHTHVALLLCIYVMDVIQTNNQPTNQVLKSTDQFAPQEIDYFNCIVTQVM